MAGWIIWRHMRIIVRGTIDAQLKVFVLRDGTAVKWTMETNFLPKEPITL